MGATQLQSGFPTSTHRRTRRAHQVRDPEYPVGICPLLWHGRSQPREFRVLPWGHQVCPLGIPGGLWKQTLGIPKESSCLPTGPGSALLCPARTRRWVSRLDGFGSPAPRGLDFHPAPDWQLPVPCLQGMGGSFSGQWELAGLAELFHLISLLLLPLSPSSFRDLEVPPGAPQAAGCVTVACLLWDGSLSFCQEARSPQRAGGSTGTPR